MCGLDWMVRWLASRGDGMALRLVVVDDGDEEDSWSSVCEPCVFA